MKNLESSKEILHSCSKCGLCQSVCPLYKASGNDCTVSRGMFIMLRGYLNNEFKLTSKINDYLDMCLKCGACSNFCPSEIDVVDIICQAKAEYFKLHKSEKIMSLIDKHVILGLGFKLLSFFRRNSKSKKFDKKVVYFGGCANKIRSNKAIINLLNKCKIEVLNPDFECCGVMFLMRGDFETFNTYIKSYIAKLKKVGIKDVVTTCASCEKILKKYTKWSDDEYLKDVNIKNIYEYIVENSLQFELKKEQKISYHKPCNIKNFEQIKYLLENTKNLEYIEMRDFDKCCGLNGLPKTFKYKILYKIFKSKRDCIINSGAKKILTSCLGCETALKTYSFGAYEVEDLIEFLSKNAK